MILRARVVMPIGSPPITDGAVKIRSSRIVEVGAWRTLKLGGRSPVIDLGEVLLMPGLVNAHCHLDYTHMAGQIPPPKSFTEWLKVIVMTKAGWNLADYQSSWNDGAAMLLRTGTTTVADMEAVPGLLPEAWDSSPLRIISFLELIAITARRPQKAVLKEALEKMSRLEAPGRLGLSPHAPYSTLPELIKLAAAAARKRRCLVSTHVAESAVEYEMFTRGHGEMFEWLSRSGRDMSDCKKGTPVQHLERNGLLGENLIAVHLNYLGKNDPELLAKTRTSVVHCPRSHVYFRHQAFALRRLANAGVNVCLGTDSLASVYKKRNERVELDMFAEMRCFAERNPSVASRRIVEMATLNGARALRLAGKVGALAAGAYGDLIAIPFTGKTKAAYEAVAHHQSPVTAVFINGASVNLANGGNRG